MIDGQYKEELKNNLLTLLREGLNVQIVMYDAKDENGCLTSVTTRVVVSFFGEILSDTEGSTN